MGTEYRQVKITVEAKLAEKFKAACTAQNASMAGVLSEHMAKYSEAAQEKKRKPSLSSKRQRRAAIVAIVEKLERIKERETEYQERIPENLQGSAAYESADRWVEMLDDAIETLGSLP